MLAPAVDGFSVRDPIRGAARLPLYPRGQALRLRKLTLSLRLSMCLYLLSCFILLIVNPIVFGKTTIKSYDDKDQNIVGIFVVSR